ncbi:hypothetical protein CG747_39650 [Streptomyces sp. CB02959]|nr:hypothetical protein CG747_39650 [Streptomyces sp. CB02959]
MERPRPPRDRTRFRHGTPKYTGAFRKGDVVYLSGRLVHLHGPGAASAFGIELTPWSAAESFLAIADHRARQTTTDDRPLWIDRGSPARCPAGPMPAPGPGVSDRLVGHVADAGPGYDEHLGCARGRSPGHRSPGRSRRRRPRPARRPPPSRHRRPGQPCRPGRRPRHVRRTPRVPSPFSLLLPACPKACPGRQSAGRRLVSRPGKPCWPIGQALVTGGCSARQARGGAGQAHPAAAARRG